MEGKVLYVQFPIKPWFILSTDLCFIVLIILCSLIIVNIGLFLEILSYLRKGTLYKNVSSRVRNILRYRDLANVLKDVGWIILAWYGFIEIMSNMFTYNGFKIDVGFFVVVITVILTALGGPYFCRLKQQQQFNEIEKENLSMKTSLTQYATIIEHQNHLLVPKPQIGDLILLIFGSLLTRLTELLTYVFKY